MIENILIYLSTINVVIFILLYLHSRFLERYKESLDELAGYLYDIQESLDNEGEEDGNTGTGNQSTSE